MQKAISKGMLVYIKAKSIFENDKYPNKIRVLKLPKRTEKKERNTGIVVCVTRE